MGVFGRDEDTHLQVYTCGIEVRLINCFDMED